MHAHGKPKCQSRCNKLKGVSDLEIKVPPTHRSYGDGILVQFDVNFEEQEIESATPRLVLSRVNLFTTATPKLTGKCL